MKFFEKQSAFDPKRLIGPAVGAASLGTLGYVTGEKDKKISAAVSTGVLGGVIGLAFKGRRGPVTKGKSFFERLSEKANPLDETEKILEKSRKAMEEIDKRKMAIKTHRTTKSSFKYEDALKHTKEKRSSFLAETKKILTGKNIKSAIEEKEKHWKIIDQNRRNLLNRIKNEPSAIVNIIPMTGAASAYLKAHKRYKKELLKTVGSWTGIGVGTAAGAAYIRK